MAKRYYFFIIGGVIIFTWFVWMVFNPPKNPDPNVYYFEGKVIDVLQSNNHAFGIIVVDLTTAHITVKDSSFIISNVNNLPPFRYNRNIGEVYCTISIDPDINPIGYKIVSDTITNSVEIIDNNNDTIAGSDLIPVSEQIDRNYVFSHSRLK